LSGLVFPIGGVKEKSAGGASRGHSSHPAAERATKQTLTTFRKTSQGIADRFRVANFGSDRRGAGSARRKPTTVTAAG
jgi:hypothetical protein